MYDENSIREQIRAIYGDSVVEAVDRLDNVYDALQPQVNEVIRAIGSDQAFTLTVTLTGPDVAACLGGIGSYVHSDTALAALVTGHEEYVFDTLATAGALVAAYQAAVLGDEVPSWLG